VCVLSAGREIYNEEVYHGIWSLSRLDHHVALFTWSLQL